MVQETSTSTAASLEECAAVGSRSQIAIKRRAETTKALGRITDRQRNLLMATARDMAK